MNFEVHFSSAAEADIDQIFDYISITLCSPIAAQNLMAKFQESVNTLSDFTEAFALCQEEPWILRDVRSMPIDSISSSVSRRPAVSDRLIKYPSRSRFIDTTSRVVPAISDTIARLDPAR